MATKSFDAAVGRALAHVVETERELQSRVRYGIAADYAPSLRELLRHEGGYDNDPDDPGGPTNYGITIYDARSYWKADATAADVRNMPLDVAKEIYRTKYWAAMRCDDLPAGVDYAVFDYGVNSGISRSAKVLQRFVGVEADGKVGPSTTAAVLRANSGTLVDQICDERLAFLKNLRTWPKYGGGWGRRVREVRALAHQMVSQARAPMPAPKPEPTPKPAPASKPVPAPTKIGLWAAIVTAAGAVAHGSAITSC
jgi:lysozyme family protein